MSQLKKLDKKFSTYPTPSDITFDDAARLLRAFGFIQRQPSGGSSHYIFIHPELESYELPIVKHGSQLKIGYVRATAAAVDLVRSLYGKDDY